MDKNGYGLPNVLPVGLVEPIEEMDMVMAKIAYDANKENEANAPIYNNINQVNKTKSFESYMKNSETKKYDNFKESNQENR